MPIGQSIWTDDTVALFKKMWDEGLSAAKCASRIPGATRNAVLGKAHRLGLSMRTASGLRCHTTRAKTAKMSAKRKLRTSPTIVMKSPSTVFDFLTTKPKSTEFHVPPIERKQLIAFDDRGNDIGVQHNECRWIYEHPGHEHYGCCARKTAAGTSWCEDHLVVITDMTKIKRRVNDDNIVASVVKTELETV